MVAALRRVQILSSHLTAQGVAGFDAKWEPRLVAKPGQTMDKLGVKNPDDVVIVSALRSAMGKANKGSFKDMPPEDMLSPVLAAVVDKVGLKKDMVDDIVVGNCNPNGFAE